MLRRRVSWPKMRLHRPVQIELKTSTQVVAKSWCCPCPRTGHSAGSVHPSARLCMLSKKTHLPGGSHRPHSNPGHGQPRDEVEAARTGTPSPPLPTHTISTWSGKKAEGSLRQFYLRVDRDGEDYLISDDGQSLQSFLAA